MKILAFIIDDISGIERPAKLVAIMLKKFTEIDPTMTARLISLFHDIPMDTLGELLKDDDGEMVFHLLVSGLAVNLVPDLIETTRVLGFARKAHG